MGLIFNEMHSSGHGLELLESSRPLLAEPKDQFVEIPLMSGSYLIPDASLRDIEVTATFIWNHFEAKLLMWLVEELLNGYMSKLGQN